MIYEKDCVLVGDINFIGVQLTKMFDKANDGAVIVADRIIL